MQVAYATKMEKVESPRRVRRRLRLQELIEANGGAAQVARESGTPKTHFSAMLAGKRGLGDELAEKLERLYTKPEGWFDTTPMVATGQAHSSNVAALSVDTLESHREGLSRYLALLSVKGRAHAKGALALLVDDPEDFAGCAVSIQAQIGLANDSAAKDRQPKSISSDGA